MTRWRAASRWFLLCAVGAILAPALAAQERARAPGGHSGKTHSNAGSPETISEGPGTVVAQRKISSEAGGFLDTLDLGDAFGSSSAALGDLDGDGVQDLAVGAPGDEDGEASDSTGLSRGAVWVLFLRPDGTVRSSQKINATQGGFGGELEHGDGFGSALASPGDIDRDGVVELAVGAPFDDDVGVVGSNRGALWLLFLRADGTVKAEQKISAAQGGFAGHLDREDWFGSSASALGDLDGDGVADLAVGTPGDEEQSDFSARGALWVLFLRADGTVKSLQKISSTQGGFTDPGYGSFFGSSVARLGDLDRDGVADLSVGARNDGGDDSGAAWILFLNRDGTVRSYQKLSASEGGLGALEYASHFGSSVAALGDLDRDGVLDLGVGAPQDAEGEPYSGATYVLFLEPSGTVKSRQKIGSAEPGFTGTLGSWDTFGSSVVALGDLDGDRIGDFFVGAPRDEAVWVLFSNPDGTVKSYRKISSAEEGYASSPGQDVFGSSLAALGDLDGDGVRDLAVGAPTPGYSGEEVWIGEVIILFLRPDGSVKSFGRMRARSGSSS